MKKASSRFSEVLSIAALLGWFVSLVGLFIFFIARPGVFDSFKDVAVFLFEFLFLGSLISYFVRRIKKNFKTYGSLSKALTNFVAQEPLIHAILWILILIQVIVFSYILPIHHVVVTVEDRLNNAIPLASIDTVQVRYENRTSFLTPESDTAAIYKTKKFLAWGDEVELVVKANGYKRYQESIQWSGLAFFEILGGNKQPIRLSPMEAEIIKVKIEAHPTSAEILVKSPFDTLFEGAGVIKIEKEQTARIKVSAAGYQAQETSYVGIEDTTLVFRLVQTPGRIMIKVFNEGGREIERMDIFINDVKIREKSGELIELPPRGYRVRLSKQLSANERAVVDEFTIPVGPGENPEVRCTARIEPLIP